MSALQASAQLAPLPVWERFFFDGDRLRAEVSLFVAAFVGDLSLLSWLQVVPRYCAAMAFLWTMSLAMLSLPFRSVNQNPYFL